MTRAKRGGKMRRGRGGGVCGLGGGGGGGGGGWIFEQTLVMACMRTDEVLPEANKLWQGPMTVRAATTQLNLPA